MQKKFGDQSLIQAAEAKMLSLFLQYTYMCLAVALMLTLKIVVLCVNTSTASHVDLKDSCTLF